MSILGVVSDTHGRLRRSLLRELQGVDMILHAGDVVDAGHLDELATVAPVRAVWGNVDGPELRRRLPEEREVEVVGLVVGMRHGHQGTEAAGLAERFPRAGMVVHGHTHEPRWERHDGLCILNPGSAGPRRPGKPVTAARVVIGAGSPRLEFLQLEE